MSEAAIVLSALFALAMMGVALAVFVRGAREPAAKAPSWPSWPSTKLS